MAKAPKPSKEKPDKAAKAAAPKPANPPAPEPKPARERSSWLARFAPGVRLGDKTEARRETPDNLWVKDPDTGEMIYRPDLEAAWWVTPSGRHMRIGPKLRFAYTFDDGAFEALPAPPVIEDPLKFVDDRPYVERLKTARKATGEPDAMAIGYGRIKDVPAVVLVQDFAFMGGSLGMAAGEGFIAAADVPAEQAKVYTWPWLERPAPSAEEFEKSVIALPSNGVSLVELKAKAARNAG